jgi:hypothetical protein
MSGGPSTPGRIVLHVVVPRFALGRLVVTANALRHLAAGDIQSALCRHLAGDWGDLDEHDRQENERALVLSNRLLSVYRGADGTRFYVITESGFALTTVLLSEDY